MEIAIVVVMGVCGLLGMVIGHPKQAAALGLLLGVLFGPLGLVAAFAIDGRPKCPHCGGRLNGHVRKCQHCGEILGPNDSGEMQQAEADYLARVRRQRSGHVGE